MPRHYRRRRRTGGTRFKKRSSKNSAFRGYTQASVPRYWPPNELTATIQSSYELSMPTAITAHANSLCGFQAWGFGSSLNGVNISHFVTDSTAGTATHPTAMVFPNHVANMSLYGKMALLSSKYVISWSSTQAVPNGFNIVSWQSDNQYLGIPTMTDTGELRVTGDCDTTAFPADPVKQLDIINSRHRDLRPVQHTNLSVDSSTNRITLVWRPDYSHLRDIGIKGPQPMSNSIIGHPSGMPGTQNALAAASLTTAFGARPWLSVIAYARNMVGGETPLRTAWLSTMKVRVIHRVKYFQRIAG